VSSEEKSKKVFENWSNVAKDNGESPDASIRDLYLRDLNTKYVISYLDDSDTIIDIGCANGFATSKYANCVKRAIGVDYIPEFVKYANKLHKRDNLQFIVGNILDLGGIKEIYGTFDKLVIERTLINLCSWEDQKRALCEADNLLKIGGLLILTEVTLQGHESIDSLRIKYGLPILEKHWNNSYIDENLLMAHLENSYFLIRRYNFGFYSLISKVIYPASIYPEEPRFDADINRIASELDQIFRISNGPGHQVLFVFKKETPIGRF
jgi:SAM-dependent methyltransferase